MTEVENLARRGQAAGQTPVVKLAAGELHVELADADVQAVHFRGSEVVQRVYMAVRDVVWNTIPGRVTAREIVQGDDTFRVTFRQRHVYDAIDVEWEGLVEGSAAGCLVYEMRATARSDFSYAKIGLNVHHGLTEYRGRSFRAHTEKGELSGTLSADIEPQLVRDGSLTAMFEHFDAISFDLDDVRAEFGFEGDRFETQDHRNWSDANYKTYGTPLSYGFPRDIRAGEQLWQRMTLRLTAAGGHEERGSVVHLAPVATPAPAPLIGHNLAGGEQTAGELPRNLLAAARPDFLRVELHPGEDVEERLAAARTLSAVAPCHIELVLAVEPERVDETVRELADVLAGGHQDIARIVVLAVSAGFSEFKTATPPALPLAVSAGLRGRGIEVPVFSGTEQFFNELNRARPDYTGLDGVVFSLNPQVHACIDRALMQNADAVADIADFSRRLYPGAALCVGPVHLLGPNGPFPGGPQVAGGPPQSLDVRHTALFGAAWTVAFLQAAVRAKVENVTLFDLVGPRGLAEHPDPAQQPVEFPSTPGRGFPLLWVLRQLREEVPPGAESLFGVGGGDRCALVGHRGSSGSRLMVANLRDEILDVRVDIATDRARITVLDETNVASTDPVVGSGPSGSRAVDGGILALTLRPYAVACIDFVSRTEHTEGMA